MSTQLAIQHREISPSRIAVVTAGLIGGGALAGGAAGVLGVSLWALFTGNVHSIFEPGLWSFAGAIGAALGAVLLPVAGFTVLRYVPLGRALSTTILGTALGGAIGAQFFNQSPLGGAIVGFVLAAGWLWSVARRARARKLRS